MIDHTRPVQQKGNDETGKKGNIEKKVKSLLVIFHATRLNECIELNIAVSFEELTNISLRKY
jgi:hypothetical protein